MLSTQAPTFVSIPTSTSSTLSFNDDAFSSKTTTSCFSKGSPGFPSSLLTTNSSPGRIASSHQIAPGLLSTKSCEREGKGERKSQSTRLCFSLSSFFSCFVGVTKLETHLLRISMMSTLRDRPPALNSQFLQLVSEDDALTRSNERVGVSPGEEGGREGLVDVVPRREVFSVRVVFGGWWKWGSDEGEEVVEMHGETEISSPRGERWRSGLAGEQKGEENTRMIVSSSMGRTEKSVEEKRERRARTNWRMGTRLATFPSKTISANSTSLGLTFLNPSQYSGFPYDPYSRAVIP